MVLEGIIHLEPVREIVKRGKSMAYSFGENFRKLRKQRELTQEMLAEYLGVSAQAISKWETNVSCPDVSLLPGIADFFGVSVDGLLGHDGSKREETIEGARRNAETLCEAGRDMDAVVSLREALLKYPGEERLMYGLARALSGTLCQSPDNYEEAIALYQKILKVSTDTVIRAKATRDLIYRYYTKGEMAAGRYYANLLPDFEVCKEYNLGRSNLLTGRELAEYLLGNISLFGDALLECLEYFVNEKILSEQEKAPLTTATALQSMERIRSVLEMLR